MWPVLTNQSALFQRSIPDFAKVNLVYEIGSWSLKFYWIWLLKLFAILTLGGAWINSSK